MILESDLLVIRVCIFNYDPVSNPGPCLYRQRQIAPYPPRTMSPKVKVETHSLKCHFLPRTLCLGSCVVELVTLTLVALQGVSRCARSRHNSTHFANRTPRTSLAARSSSGRRSCIITSILSLHSHRLPRHLNQQTKLDHGSSSQQVEGERQGS